MPCSKLNGKCSSTIPYPLQERVTETNLYIYCTTHSHRLQHCATQNNTRITGVYAIQWYSLLVFPYVWYNNILSLLPANLLHYLGDMILKFSGGPSHFRYQNLFMIRVSTLKHCKMENEILSFQGYQTLGEQKILTPTGKKLPFINCQINIPWCYKSYI